MQEPLEKDIPKHLRKGIDGNLNVSEVIFSFPNEHEEKLWLAEQCRLLWEFLENEDMADEADKFVKENGGSIIYWAVEK